MTSSRRSFLAAMACTPLIPEPRSWRARRPTRIRDKLRLGIIGVDGRGTANLNAVAEEEIVALCDVDARPLAEQGARFRDAKQLQDAREMIDTLDLDGVVISTPDHTHATLTARALRRGLHVYCEKPLTHTVREARVVRQLAKQHGRVTQMGIQIHAGENYRRVVEAIRGDAVGEVREVHVFCGSNWSNGRRPGAAQEVPAWLRWDLWLGPAPSRPWHAETYHPVNWRRFWDFGGGTLADMACHFLDLAWWALELRPPTRIRADGPKPHREGTPDHLHVEFEHPGRGADKTVRVHWYDGGKRPALLRELGLEAWKNGVLFVGEDERWLISDYGRHALGPKARFEGYTAPPRSIPKSIGHHAEWIRACKTDGRPSCDFDYAGPLTEAVLLGGLAYRTGTELHWDASRLAIENSEEAQALLDKPYARGWEL